MSARLIQILLVSLGASSLTACTTAGSSIRPRSFHAKIQRVTSDATVVLNSGKELRLAGIRMRTEDETQEPELLDVVNDIIRRASNRVRVERDTVSDTVVVYYRQRIYYQPEYIVPISATLNTLRPTTAGTVNELLIVMGAAKYDPAVGGMTEEAQRRCEVAAEKAELAMWEKHRARRLVEYKSGSAQLYTNYDGYRARITQGDLPQRDRNLAESAEKPK